MLRVKSICKDKGLTLKELATRMDVSPEALTRMLSETGNPTLSSITNIAKALDVEAYELFDDFYSDIRVKGFIQVDEKIHSINSFKDLEFLYQTIKSQ